MKTIKISSISADYKKVLEIRRKVFIEEQQVPEELEIDEFEESCDYFLTITETPVATGRLRVKGAFIKFERIATLKDHRGQGIGSHLMQAMQDYCARYYPLLIPYMHSQCEAVPFYQRLGWIAQGDLFFEANIPHLVMTLPR